MTVRRTLINVNVEKACESNKIQKQIIMMMMMMMVVIYVRRSASETGCPVTSRRV
jgi:hypothetical protein